VILTEWKFVPVCTSAEEAEVLECLEGLRHLIDLRQWPARLETDCFRVVHAISGHDQDRSLNWTYYDEARELLKIYKDIKVVKVDRASNAVAHGLAQLGKAGASGSLRHSAPTCVLELIMEECEVRNGP
jgi:ribonuclease HI